MDEGTKQAYKNENHSWLARGHENVPCRPPTGWEEPTEGPRCRLWHSSSCLGQGLASHGCSQARADRSGDSKAHPPSGDMRLPGGRQTRLPHQAEVQGVSNFPSLSPDRKEACMQSYKLSPHALFHKCPLDKTLTWLILSWQWLLGGLQLT